jgi:2,4-dienoyl-CoA reductase-like NADH-dependent reductase (Old Yellow Enzyme family)/ribulose 1,5-bisphosphate synthetase/thiazole synthase
MDTASTTGPAAGRAFPHLFSPLRIGSVSVRNRIVSSGHDTVMAEHGLVSDQLVAYQEARARGGVGLIVIQVAGVHPTARYTSHELTADDDACIPGFRRLAEVAHANGATIFGQLFHGGREIMDTEDGTLAVALAPSPVPTERFHVMPRAMPVPLIREIVDGFGASAARLEAAGLDGVEVVASHGYLPSQFLNPRTNLRTDEYGGDDVRRRRFLREALAACRATTREGFVVGLRISIGEVTPDGLTEDEALAALAALDADGAMDYVSVVAGTSATLAGSDHIVPPSPIANGYTAPLAARARAAVRVPVMVAGRISQPQEAEAILAAGQADACVMTRALICDPELPAKSSDGRVDDIRACIGCNQACIGHFHAGYPISCIQFPESGREREFPRVGTPGSLRHPAATTRRSVLVVGGGPGGLKAAAVAAERGHRVTLVEAGRRVGGQVLLAQELPGRAEMAGAVTNLLAEAQRAGVDIRTGTRADLAYVRAAAPDAVIVATGAVPYRPPLEVMGEPVIMQAWDVIRGAALPDGHVVVADFRSDWVGLGLASLLAGRGHRVTLAVVGTMAGQRIQQYVRDTMTASARRARVDIRPTTRLFGADSSAVFLQDVLTGDAVVIEDTAALVLAQGQVPEDGLLSELEAEVAAGASFTVQAVGDVLSPRTIEEAVLEGLRAAVAI